MEKLPKPEIAPPRTNRQHGPLQTVMEDVDDSENQPKRPIIPGPSPVTSPLRVGRLLDQPKEENGEMTSTLKYRYDESLDGGSHSDRRAQALSIQDSIQLQEEQKKKHQVSAGLILGLRTANGRRRYFVTTSLIGWAQA